MQHTDGVSTLPHDWRSGDSYTVLVAAIAGTGICGCIVCCAVAIVVTIVSQIRIYNRRRRKNGYRRCNGERNPCENRDCYSVRGDPNCHSHLEYIQWNRIFRDNPYCVDAIDM